jgi:hypothetical protein
MFHCDVCGMGARMKARKIPSIIKKKENFVGEEKFIFHMKKNALTE